MRHPPKLPLRHLQHKTTNYSQLTSKYTHENVLCFRKNELQEYSMPPSDASGGSIRRILWLRMHASVKQIHVRRNKTVRDIFCVVWNGKTMENRMNAQ
mmetsp:Transcript_20104/g.41665  ORF Transcript_20104/g.41665 Transcript_20104/m.41665 type:complete len:98 (-) Transcript_20104:1140-1433(-)